MLWNVKKVKKIRKKRQKLNKMVQIKSITLQDLMTEAKMVKQEIKEIKENNSTDIDEQNIAEIINLKEFSKPMIDLPLLEKDDGNRHNFLSIIVRVIFQKWHIEIILVINKEFSLTEIALIDSGADMNCIQEGLIHLKYYEKSSERLT